jgi:hypothetical protein
MKTTAPKPKHRLHRILKKKVSLWLVAAVTLAVLISWLIIGRVALWVNPPKTSLILPLGVPSVGLESAPDPCPSGRVTENGTLTYRVPAPWTVTKERVPVYDCMDSVRHTFIRDKYQVEIFTSASGRATCTPEEGMPMHTFRNPVLSGQTGSPAFRTDPDYVMGQPADTGLYLKGASSIRLILASKMSAGTDAYDCSTHTGIISYDLPIPWDLAILAQMDAIVESVRD